MITLESISPAEQFQRDGYVIFRQLLSRERIESASQEVDRVRKEFDHLISVKNLRCRWQDNVFTGECQFDAFDPIIDLSPLCKKLAYDPILVSAISDLYGEQACLFKDKVIYKLPGAKGYQLHQDWIAWERFPRSFLSVLVPFDSADESNGCTIVYPGYHHDGPLTPTDGHYHPLPTECVEESKAVPLCLEPGDIGVFGGFTPHRSDPNLSDRPRRQLYLSYTKQSDGGELREVHYDDFRIWLKKKYTEYGKPDTYFE
jgi:2-aminoethylphosphonate dioxygenase